MQFAAYILIELSLSDTVHAVNGCGSNLYQWDAIAKKRRHTQGRLCICEAVYRKQLGIEFTMKLQHWVLGQHSLRTYSTYSKAQPPSLQQVNHNPFLTSEIILCLALIPTTRRTPLQHLSLLRPQQLHPWMPVPPA